MYLRNVFIFKNVNIVYVAVFCNHKYIVNAFAIVLLISTVVIYTTLEMLAVDIQGVPKCPKTLIKVNLFIMDKIGFVTTSFYRCLKLDKLKKLICCSRRL